MKNIYLKPLTETVEVILQQIIAASEYIPINESENPIEDEGGVAVRRRRDTWGNIWDDEEEDEEEDE